MRLSSRLKMAAEMVRKGVIAADIGTDHAFLPVYLVLNGVCPSVLASDINSGPLKNAADTVKSFSLESKISLRLSNGLNNIFENEAQDFIFAGMGGTLIARLADEAGWLKNESKRLIIQPMTRAEDVRQYLCENGFKILTENAVEEDGRVYIAMCAEYDGIERSFSPAYFYCGELNTENPAAKKYINAQINRLKKKAEALKHAEKNEDEVILLNRIINEMELKIYDS